MAKPEPRTTNRYGDEFKATAVKLSQLPGVLVTMSLSHLQSTRTCLRFGATMRERG
jgi:transposase-like protein